MSFPTIFLIYRDGVWMWQEVQCSLLDVASLKYDTPNSCQYSIQSLYTDTGADQFWFLALHNTFKMLSAMQKSSWHIFEVISITQLRIDPETSHHKAGDLPSSCPSASERDLYACCIVGYGPHYLLSVLKRLLVAQWCVLIHYIP